MKEIALLIALGSCLVAFTQENDTTALEPVEVRAVRAGANAPFAKTNLSRQQIERENLGQDLPFLLRQTPSVVVNSDAGNGVGYTGIRIRGTDATRINVTLNGIPYNDAESLGTFLVDLPDVASSVSSIQVQRGVGTSSNGAGAFGGTINLSTNQPNLKQYAAFNNSYGSFNTWKNTVKAGTGLLNNHFTADVRLSNITSDGYIDRASTNLKSLYFSTAYLSGATDLRFNILSGKQSTYQAWNGVSEADLKTRRTYNTAGTDRPGSPYANETDNYLQTHYQLFFTQRFAPQLVFNTALFLTQGKGYYEQYKASKKYADYGLTNTNGATRTDLIRQLWLENDFYGNIFSLLYDAGKTQLNLGGAITRYLGRHFGEVIWAKNGGVPDHYRWYDLDATKNDWNIYAKWQQQLLPALQFYADLQYRNVAHNISGFRDHPQLVSNHAYGFFNPKAGVSLIKKNWLLYGSYSIAHKEPNRDDFEAAANTPLPERLNDLELGFENRNSNSNFGVNAYFMKYKNQLVLTGKINDVGAYTRTNINNSYRAGIELQASVLATKWLKASGNLTFSQNKIKNFTEYIDDYDGDQKQIFYPETDISFSPNIVGAATITLMAGENVSIDFLSKYVGRQYLDNTANPHRMLNAYYTQDVRAIFSPGFKWLQKADFIFQVNNIFNKMYEPNGYTYSYISNSQLTTENYYFPMAGTNWMAGINLKF